MPSKGQYVYPNEPINRKFNKNRDYYVKTRENYFDFFFDLYQIAMLAFFIVTTTQGNINKNRIIFRRIGICTKSYV